MSKMLINLLLLASPNARVATIFAPIGKDLY